MSSCWYVLVMAKAQLVSGYFLAGLGVYLDNYQNRHIHTCTLIMDGNIYFGAINVSSIPLLINFTYYICEP